MENINEKNLLFGIEYVCVWWAAKEYMIYEHFRFLSFVKSILQLKLNLHLETK